MIAINQGPRGGTQICWLFWSVGPPGSKQMVWLRLSADDPPPTLSSLPNTHRNTHHPSLMPVCGGVLESGHWIHGGGKYVGQTGLSLRQLQRRNSRKAGLGCSGGHDLTFTHACGLPTTISPTGLIVYVWHFCPARRNNNGNVDPRTG